MGPILLFTDFGYEGPYVGEMKAAVAAEAPGCPVIDLMHDAPPFRPDLAGHLLAALVPQLPAGAVICGVVDPGVGTDRLALVQQADHRWFVGPDNGLFDVVAARAGSGQRWALTERPARLSASFHGRDLFAPTAAKLAMNRPVGQGKAADPAPAAEADCDRVIYIDGYGNVMTGRRAQGLPPGMIVEAGGRALRYARTFGDVPPGTAFWYENSAGLLELAVNQGRAAGALGLGLGDRISLRR